MLNPIGVKLSAKADADDVLRLIDKVDPDREPGRLTFITRMGAKTVREALPTIVEKVTGVRRPGHLDLRPDARQHLRVGHRLQDPRLRRRRRGGARASSRCTGASAPCPAASTSSSPATTSPSASAASEKILDADLNKRYETVCDPRLNHQQSLELAFLVAEMLARTERRRAPPRAAASTCCPTP